MSVAAALATPATSVPAPTVQALVLNQARQNRGTTIAANTVLALLTLPAMSTYVPPADCRLIAAGNLQVGDIVTP